jgi:cytochrome c oxidase assembly factor CtaG
VTELKLDPFAIAVLTATAAMYAGGCTQVRVRRIEALAFVAGWLVLAIALLSPIATLSEALFSVHMTQHELLMLVAAPLLTVGRPGVPMLMVLPLRTRLQLGGIARSRLLAGLMAPLTVFLLHAAALWVWHLPVLYEAAVRSDSIHLVQHVCFTATACLFWWGLLHGRYGRLGYGAAVLYVFATAVHTGGLGALLTFADRPLYPLYVARAHAHGVDALADQQLAGLLMWIPAGVVLILFGLALFAAWLGESERRRRVTS